MRNYLLLLCSCMPLLLAAQNILHEKQNLHVKVGPVAGVRAYAFNLTSVRILEGSPFKNAMDKDAAYLLAISPDRLLHRFHKHAGLAVKDSVYGGWESEGLSGHTLGHYLSACAMMYASTGDERFKQKADYITGELQRCQQSRKTGYIGAIPNEDSIFGQLARGEIRSGGFDLNGGWAPWYTVHKIMAGLLDTYFYCDNKTALAIAGRMGDWVYNTIAHLTQENLDKMLRCEFGGMNDVLAALYSITGDKKYLGLSYKFFDNFVMEPLSKEKDPMPGKHANTQVPKAIGSARQYALTGNEKDKTIASFFWKTMTQHHSYVIGGNSNYEYCGAPDSLSQRLSDNTAETCNTHNMLKLTRHLYSWQPHSGLMDYYERALYNHILASQNPQTGMMCYFVPLRMGAKKEFSDPFNTFTCCVGTGIENHAKYGESIYSEGADGSLYVNLFIPSQLLWKEKHVTVTQSTTFPESAATRLTIQSAGKKRFKIHIRQPAWNVKGPIVKINGVAAEITKDQYGFLTIDRVWNNNDQISIEFFMQLYTESMPDNPDRIAFLYGPIVLAGQLGKEMTDPVYGAPVLLTDNRNIGEWVQPAANPLQFKLNGVAKPADVELIPFYKTYDEHYNVYWDYFTPEKWLHRKAAYEEEKLKQQQLEQRTVDLLRLGEMQPERDHKLEASEQSYTEIALGRGGREVRNGGFFSFQMKVLPGEEMILLLSYLGDDRGRAFDILVDDVKIATQELKGAETGKFLDVEYPLPISVTRGKESVVVKIQAHPRRTAGRVFSPRILRKI